MQTGYQSTVVGFACPVELDQWLRAEAARRGLTKSRLVATILLDVSGLDITLQHPGRPAETARQRDIREIEEATGQVPFGTRR